MKQNIYSIYDRLSGYMDPVIYDNHAVAMRNFECAMICENKNVPRLIDDFSLYQLGEFDTVSGQIMIPSICPLLIMRGSEVRDKYAIQD